MGALRRADAKLPGGRASNFAERQGCPAGRTHTFDRQDLLKIAFFKPFVDLGLSLESAKEVVDVIVPDLLSSEEGILEAVVDRKKFITIAIKISHTKALSVSRVFADEESTFGASDFDFLIKFNVKKVFLELAARL